MTVVRLSNINPEKRLRLFARTKRGFYHDGRFDNLPAVVGHYNRHFGLGLRGTETADLVEYLKSS